MAKTNYFTAKSLTVGYGKVPLISDIDFTAEKGKILTLIGPNGAGKTTILRSLARQLELLGGTVCLDGRSMEELPRTELSKRMAVVLTQRVKTELFTCGDMVATGRYPYTGRFGILSKEDWKAVDRAMQLVHVMELKERDFEAISDGQKQRVMLARAICQEPEILLLDEPTSYLDIRYKLEFLSILQEMTRKQNLTVILSLHELDLAERISDKILCVKGDHIDRIGTPEEIFSDGYINQLYDIQMGSYDEVQGRVELVKTKGEPECFILAGGGKAAGLYRSLQRKGIAFSTGILQENDIDYPAACSLAVRVIAEEAFSNVREETFRKARAEIDRCMDVYCTIPRFGELNEANRRLWEYAKEVGKARE